jgi:hypothetical protein
VLVVRYDGTYVLRSLTGAADLVQWLWLDGHPALCPPVVAAPPTAAVDSSAEARTARTNRQKKKKIARN